MTRPNPSLAPGAAGSRCAPGRAASRAARQTRIALAALASLLLAAPAFAQSAGPAEVEIDRDPAALETEIRPRPDTDVADTVLTFTSLSRAPFTLVQCVGRDRSGAVVGRVRVRVPARGVKYVLASDFSQGADFVGSAVCKTGGAVDVVAVFLGPQITDLPTRSGRYEGLRIHRFPLIATY